ncbi:twitching motility protein [Ectopseudomonas mendocina]|uniref:Twitching motility protein n=1 Tax=Ectopseudomonas mendocina TaxID=300 RepID=A0A379IPT9_ECTME|nr:twitching motility protein [Pseudomonas mendocina]
MEFEKLLRLMVEKGGSDLFITAGVPPSMKVNGKIMPVTKNAMSPEMTRETVLGVMNEAQRRDFAENHECNFAISARGIGRFRVSAFYQRNLVGMVLRRIETTIPTIDELKLPDILKKLSLTKRGLVLFVGATGTGKSTSLAAMIGYRNRNSSGHIISIEDPIEYIHQHQSCIVTQREVGIDTESFEVALKNTLRQAPDVIMIGEVRTRETMDHAVAFAETGPCAWPPCTPTTPTRRWTASSTSSQPTGRTRCGWICRSTSRPSSPSNWCRPRMARDVAR